jgi:SAM-dependent methyltransferase
MNNPEKNYHKTRFQFDPGRLKVWRAITEHLQHYVSRNGSVLDLGCGYGDFINQIKAKEKYALDIGPDVKEHINKDVNFINAPSVKIDKLNNNSIDVIFSSNLLEHLDRNEIDKTMLGIQKILKNNGTLILIGPNYRYCHKEYFDDYTHKTIFSHITLVDLLYEYGFTARVVKPRFLPLTLKSKLPKSYWLTKVYLLSPVKPMGKQMLLIFDRIK